MSSMVAYVPRDVYEAFALMEIDEHGPRFAGTGSGAISDAAWHLLREGVLAVTYRDGLPYLERHNRPASPESPLDFLETRSAGPP